MEKTQFGSLRVRVLTGRRVYRLIHSKGKYHDEAVKELGIFSSKTLAQETAKLLQKNQIFETAADDFTSMIL